jgi:hypothetical protein
MYVEPSSASTKKEILSLVKRIKKQSINLGWLMMSLELYRLDFVKVAEILVSMRNTAFVKNQWNNPLK